MNRERIIGLATDAMTDLLYYGRKDADEVGQIEHAILNGVVTIDEIMIVMRNQLQSSVTRHAQDAH